MNLDFRKLLPSNIRETRWGELASVMQSIYSDIKIEKFLPIKNQKISYLMSNQELFDFCYMLGYTVVKLDGYTSSYQYLYRQAKTLKHRIKKKTTRCPYQTISYIYDLIGEAYPMAYDDINNTLLPVYDYYDVINSWNPGVTEFDRELNLDGTPSGKPMLLFDTPEFPTFDMTGVDKHLTRHIVFSYENYFIEEADKFFSIDTTKALHSDLNFINRITEVIYVEPILKINVLSDNTVTSKIYTSYDGDISINYDSILIGSDFITTNEITVIKFGNGKHTDLDLLNSGSDIEGTIIYTLDVTDETHVKEFNWTDIRFNIAKAITEYCQLEPITEVALFDISGLVCYCTFPEISFYYKLYSNIILDINII